MRSQPRRDRRLPRLLLIALSYLLTGLLGLNFYPTSGFATLIWGQMTIEAAMKFRTTSRALIAAAFLAGAVPAAQAFTFQDSHGSSGGGQGFMDLDKPAAPPDRLGTGLQFGSENGQTTMKQGNTTFQFGQQRSFDQRYNTNNLFDPYAREGR